MTVTLAQGALMPTYRRYPLTLVRGEGTRVFDESGRAYLDFAGGIAALPLGHGHPAWVRAVTEQASALVHVSNLFRTLPQERLAERLSGLAGFGQVFLANSGAEANEAALKIARLHGREAGRVEVVALQGSFHGRTFSTLAATGQPDKHGPFEPLPEGFVHIAPNDAAALEAAVGDRTAAVLIEPILGEGGVLPLDAEYVALARRLCTERGALLLIDEVQTGVGRCGTWFGYQALGIEPDVFTLAKGLGNGLPVAATVAREEVAFGPGEHASTFGGGPVPCAGALAVLDAIEAEGLLENCRARGEQLIDGLREPAHPAIADVRGRGLLVGVELDGVSPGAVVRALIERGFLATEAGPRVVRLAPPLSVSAEEVDAFVAAFPAAVSAASADASGGGR